MLLSHLLYHYHVCSNSTKAIQELNGYNDSIEKPEMSSVSNICAGRLK
ncbi:hypothetical protein SLEP1_g44471 [Rubroshorea leprosula]|uniref:Uncharacterized protein n=1 Tax=Rubroshorea leprosula TaxID=152421 RepID=A0AAV5LI63_9ROSI|nr:hypothetical protein SLEP1_g44471 [Rubroshorea leprosula]